MATNIVTGTLRASNGTMIPLQQSAAEGTEFSLQTDATYTTTAMSAGDYGQGLQITHGLVSAVNSIAYCYILRQGTVLVNVNVSTLGSNTHLPPLPKPVTLMPGDEVRVLHLASATRTAAAQVYTSTGLCRVFYTSSAPSGAATTELVDLQTGNSIGSTLQGQTVVSGWMTSVDAGKISSPGGGGVFVNDANNVIGTLAATNPAAQQPLATMIGAPINLNYKLTIETSS